MKVAIVNLTAGGMSGGYRKYLKNIIPRLAGHPKMDAILCAAPSQINIHGEFDKLLNVQFVSCKPLHVLHRAGDAELHSRLEQFGPDVVYVPVERFFKHKKVPTVTMLQNMEPFVFPLNGNPVSEKIKNLIRMESAKKAIRNSERLIAISEFVKNFLISRCGISASKIGMVYHGLDIPKEAKNARCSQPIPSHWENGFLFTAGSIRPARGLDDILYALLCMRRTQGKLHGIVIAGSADPVMVPYQKKLIRWIEKHGLSTYVLWAGQLSENEMLWYYRNCSAFIMSSRVESFGQIAAEAMANACLCISSESPCLPEIFRDAALYYPRKTEKHYTMPCIRCSRGMRPGRLKCLNARNAGLLNFHGTPVLIGPPKS